MNRVGRRAWAQGAGVVAVASFVVAPSALAGPGPIYNDGAFDLPNFPTPAAPNITLAPGVNHVASGVILSLQVDVDFIQITVPFATNMLVVDLDAGNSSQNPRLGIAQGAAYPNPLLENDDDLDGPIDIMGVSTRPLDSAVDVTAVLGSPIPASTTFMVAIARSNDLLYQGNVDTDLKLEYQLYVFAQPVPAPGAGAATGLGLLTLASRRRRR